MNGEDCRVAETHGLFATPSLRRGMMARMRLRLLSALLVWVTSTVLAQTLPPTLTLAGADQRQATTLNGRWHYIVDPYRNGWDAFQAELPAPRSTGYIADAHQEPGGPVVEYDWAKEPELAVPGDWNSQRPELLFYEGLLWYQRNVTFHPKPGMRSFLHFGAVDYRANVAVNGKNLCEHEGGYTSFDCDATDVLKDGENSIVVAVDNVRMRDRVPTIKSDWWNYGGITGEVSIVEVPSTFIDDDGLKLERGEGDRITGYAHVSGALGSAGTGQNAGTNVELRIPELGIDAQSKTDAIGRAAFSVTPKALERWSPEHPRLYKVEWRAGGDTLTDEVGFRTVEVRGSEILLNGKSIYLRGISMHAEVPRSYPGYPASKTGRAWSDADAKLLLGWAKNLDCNFVRMAHYPYPETFLREADRQGLLVWSEIPVYWAINWTSPAALASAKQQLHEMIGRDRNRASIAMWSLSNETPVSPERTAFIRQLIDDAREQDPSRLITSAMLTPMHKDASGRMVATLDDPLTQYLDVLGQNEYIGWYTGKSDDAPEIRWVDPTGKPVIVSEFGGGAKAGLHGAVAERWTEEYQAHLFEQQFAMIAKQPFIRGVTPWVLMDFRSPTRQLPGVQDGYNRKGLFSPAGEKKAAYGVVREHYAAIESK